MKFHGDIPQVDRDLAVALKEAELDIDLMTNMPTEDRAKAYTCLAHDWYHLESEEEGDQLLLKAERVCPGYSKVTINEHTKEDPSFAFLVQNMTAMILKRFRR